MWLSLGKFFPLPAPGPDGVGSLGVETGENRNALRASLPCALSREESQGEARGRRRGVSDRQRV